MSKGGTREPGLFLPPQGRGAAGQGCRLSPAIREEASAGLPSTSGGQLSDGPEPRLPPLPQSHLAKLSGQFPGTGDSVARDNGIVLLALG